MKYIKLFELSSGRVLSKRNFGAYMLSFYGKDGLFDTFPEPLTTKTINKYLDKFIEKRKLEGKWCGDTIDREIFRDYLLFKLKVKNIDKLENDITPYLSDLEININKYNL